MKDNYFAVIKEAAVKTLPVMAGYLVLGIGFGILLKQAGFGLFWAFFMSLSIYAGSMQYVAISFLTEGASLLTVILTTVMVNARHLFYGISMIEKYGDAGKLKGYLIFALTDETYSILCSEEGKKEPEKKWFQFFVSVLNQFYWITGSVLGSVLGGIITFDTTGIEFSMTALFVTVFTEQWLNAKNHFPALVGLISSVACLIIFGPERFLIPSMILITVLLFLAKDKIKAEET